MKLYRDMTPAEREQSDWRLQSALDANKEIAEEEMSWFDRLSPEGRKFLRKEDFPA